MVTCAVILCRYGRGALTEGYLGTLTSPGPEDWQQHHRPPAPWGIWGPGSTPWGASGQILVVSVASVVNPKGSRFESTPRREIEVISSKSVILTGG